MFITDSTRGLQAELHKDHWCLLVIFDNQEKFSSVAVVFFLRIYGDALVSVGHYGTIQHVACQ